MKAILLVIDGLGVGEMPDVAQERPQDRGANTLASIVQQVPDLRLPILSSLGLGNIISLQVFPSARPGPLASYGRCQLAHEGADSYLGHQEIMGVIPDRPTRTLLTEVAGQLQEQLQFGGHRVSRPLPGSDVLLVDGTIVIGDNLEADPGQNINLTVALAETDFNHAIRVGQLVRDNVKVARVIVFGGPAVTVSDILAHIRRRSNGQVGVDSPAIGAYDENLLVRHMGYGVDPAHQLPQILRDSGYPVILLGKMADVIACEGALRDPLVATSRVMNAISKALMEFDTGLIAATIQETDLAGHEGDAHRMATVLEQIDHGLEGLLPLLGRNDCLIVCADHGNDPTISVGRHTREETPLLIWQPGQPARPLGVRRSLADIGATLSKFFGVRPCKNGHSIF